MAYTLGYLTWLLFLQLPNRNIPIHPWLHQPHLCNSQIMHTSWGTLLSLGNYERFLGKYFKQNWGWQPVLISLLAMWDSCSTLVYGVVTGKWVVTRWQTPKSQWLKAHILLTSCSSSISIAVWKQVCSENPWVGWGWKRGGPGHGCCLKHSQSPSWRKTGYGGGDAAPWSFCFL